ncbi:MAG TPA: MBL fold metallo-hydrolase [Pyrinomonadaceae bacterium]
MNQKIAVPKDAAAVILLKDEKVLWARRNPEVKFLGGWHAFPGGKVEASDDETSVKNCEDKELEKFIVAAVRETFEEVGILLVRNGDKLTKGQRASLHDDLISGRNTLAEILADWNLWIDAEDFFYTGFWTTPQFSPVRFKTRFFLAVCPPKQEPYAAISELQTPEFIAPQNALKRWTNSEVLISPPVLISLQTLAAKEIKENLNADSDESAQRKSEIDSKNQRLKNVSQILLQKSRKFDGNIDYIELNSRIICLPLKTETLPPATHTNCFIVGRKKFVVIDAAARDENEQNKFLALVDELIKNGGVCREIIVSHHHRDHIGGERNLRKYLSEKYDMRVPVSAHYSTLKSAGDIKFEDFDKTLSDGDCFILSDENGEEFKLEVLHAPGHARGHLCFYDQEKGFLLSSDNVVGNGTVVIAPPEGNMSDYLKSLERMRNLPNLRFLCGSHGAAVFDARGKIKEYIAHRLEREKQVLEALKSGAKTPAEIVARVYPDLSSELFIPAEKTVSAHLEKLADEGNLRE